MICFTSSALYVLYMHNTILHLRKLMADILVLYLKELLLSTEPTWLIMNYRFTSRTDQLFY